MSEVSGGLIVVLLILLLVFGAGFVCGTEVGRNHMKKEAVERGYGTWTVSPSGWATWNWKEPLPE